MLNIQMEKSFPIQPYLFFHNNGDLKGGVLTGRDITRLIKLQSNMNLDIQQPETTEYISQSKVMDNIKKMVIRAAASDSSIFINGESGVGKEIIARMIYNYSQRREKPFTCNKLWCNTLRTFGV